MKTAPVRLAAAIFWLVSAGAGVFLLEKYQNTPGKSRGTPIEWPGASKLARPHYQPTLVMFAHPACPCTRASIEELNRLLARCRGRLTAQVLFYQPGALSNEWSQQGSWSQAKAIPFVRVQTDRDGIEARRFGAETSGFVVLYNAAGKLLFRGGITAARGHEGDNAGVESIVALVTGQELLLKEAPVFGCALLDPTPARPD